MSKQSSRLLSLDVMRGMTIAGMILVNNPGSWGNIYEPLEHAEWNGLTPTDLVFPFFMFIMGVSTYFSLRKYQFEFSWPAIAKILRRTVVIFLIGWAISWFSMTWGGLNRGESFWHALDNFSSLRYLGVFPRLALCYGVTALLALLISRKGLKWIVAVLLVAYSLILLCGDGFVFTEENIVGVVDRAILGPEHMYSDSVAGVTLSFDPEGLLSTLPSIAHCIIGFLCGGMIVANKDNKVRSYNLFIIGAVLTIAGFLLNYGLPINKKIWSPTFVLTTCGLAATVLGLLIWIIDIRNQRRWCTFFNVFGTNPLFLYVVSTVLAITLARILVGPAGEEIPLKIAIYKDCILPLCCDVAKLASVTFAILFVLLNWCIGYILYRKKIFIKI